MQLTAAINKQHAELLQKLCKLKQAWCLPKEQGTTRVDRAARVTALSPS